MTQQIVQAYLSAMEARDLARARSMLAPEFTMTFPGGRRFDALEAMIAWSATRYRSVRKSYERFDEMATPDRTIVYCYGVLDGEGLDGLPISGVRFIDRFELVDGLIVDQQVWNDLGEYRIDRLQR